MDTLQTSSVEATTPAGTNSTNGAGNAAGQRTHLNQGQGSWLTNAEQILANAQNDTELAARLQARGYTAAKVAQGSALVADARRSVNARQTAQAEYELAKTALAAQHGLARRKYANFRVIARNTLASADATAALLLDDTPPYNLRRFIHMAHVTYQTALERPAYVAALTEAGYAQADIEALDAEIDALAAAEDALRSARAQAKQATQHRNQVAKNASQWFKRFRNIARVALRDRPDLAARLGVAPL